MNITFLLLAFGLGYLTAAAMFLVAHLKDASRAFVVKEVEPKPKQKGVDFDGLADKEYSKNLFKTPLT